MTFQYIIHKLVQISGRAKLHFNHGRPLADDVCTHRLSGLSRPHYCTSDSKYLLVCLLLAAALRLGRLSSPEQIRKDLRRPFAGLQIRELNEVITPQKLFIKSYKPKYY